MKPSASTSASTVLTKERGTIDKNRLKALHMRPYPYARNFDNGSIGKRIIKVKRSKFIDSGRGFLIQEHEEPQAHMAYRVTEEPAIAIPIAYKECGECKDMFTESYLLTQFDYEVCDECRDSEEKHSLITRKEAKNEYFLKDCDLDKREPKLKFITCKNPHNVQWGDMMYLRLQIEKRALEVWGSEENLLEEREQRDEKRGKAKVKKYNKQLKGKETSTPMQNIEENSHKQSCCSRSLDEENFETGVNSRKRRRIVTGKDDRESKKPRNESFEFPSDLQDESRQDVSDELHNVCQTKQYRNDLPRYLIGLMYRLDLSVLCLLRKLTHEHKYPSMLLAFGDSEIDKFNNIVLRYKKKSIYIQIENVDKYYTDNDISYARLFTKGKQGFSINNYLNSFAKHITTKAEGLSNNIEHLVIYTNADLSLTEGKKFKKGQSRGFYPFKFDGIDMEACEILKDFLFTSDNVQGLGFYHFSQDTTTRQELLKRLEFSFVIQKVIKERKLSQEEIKEAFLDKLVFAVNQPNREELNIIIKSEMEKNSKVQDNYIKLQERILSTFEEHTKLGNYISGVMYEFNLLMLLLHDMFLHKNMFSINFEEKSHDNISNDITINYKDRITCVKVYNANNVIGYSHSQLFPCSQQKSMVSINELFTFFIEKLGEDIEYFIIYTNADLNLTEKKKLKKRQSKVFYPSKFVIVDTREEKYTILRDCSCINKNGFYQFAQEETTKKKLLSLLKLPPSLQKGRLSNDDERGKKEEFLDKLIFAINQPNTGELSSIAKNEIDKSNKVAYNYEELQEITLRWSESHEFGPITEEIMKKLFEDIKNKKPSFHQIQNKDIDEVKFAKSVVGSEGTLAFNQFLDFLIKGEGRKYLEVLKRHGINLASTSSILDRAKTNARKAFEDLFNLWFDEKGDKTQYLKALGKEGIHLSSMSSILSGAGSNAAKAFKDLYELWFDEKGNKTQYLKALEDEGINLANMSSILSRAGSNAARAYKELYDLWFDAKGSKTRHLKTLEEEEINLSNVSSILSRAGSNAARAFKELYDLWFDAKGSKTQYLKTLEEQGINLSNVSSILNGTRTNAAKVFKDLYDLWFDKQGNKTQYLITLEGKGIRLTNISGILSKAGSNAAKAFKDLYDLWFDAKGNKTQYLKTLEREGINLTNMSSMLNGAGSNAAIAFKDLYDLWFDTQGNKTPYSKTLEEEGIDLSNMSSVLNGAGSNAARASKDLYDLWFDKQGNKTQYLKTLEENGVSLTNISCILSKAGFNSAKAFKDLYYLWFDAEGTKTQYLKTLEQEGINLTNMSSILHGAGHNAEKAFKDLYDLWFDKEGNKTQYLKTLEGEGVNLSIMSSMLNGAGSNAARAFEDLHDLWFDKHGNKSRFFKSLEGEGINVTNMSSILHGAGSNATNAFKELYDLWFDAKGNKTQYLKTLKGEGVNLSNMSSVLNGAGSNAAEAFKYLYDLWFDKQGNKTQYLKTLEGEGINLTNMSSMLSGAGSNSVKAFKELYYALFDEQGNTTQNLNHFIKKRDDKNSFTLHNLSGILSRAGTSAKDAFEKLHSACFNDKGKRTELLVDFYNAGFRPSNLSCMLCGAGFRASSILKKLHSACFNDEGKRTELLDDFFNAGFRPCDLCNILSGAADSVEKFHDFCFIAETKIYLNHFINGKEIFTPKSLSNILHGAGANICSAFKGFHDVCFDEKGNITQLLDDFYKADFSPSDLSNILFLAGNNAPSILRNFHKLCFNKENYLNHFSAEEKLFTPKNVSKILRGVGINICTIFEKLHDLCFDKAGNKTNNLNNLIKNDLTKNNQHKILNILHGKVRKTTSTSLENISLQQQNISKMECELSETSDGKDGNPGSSLDGALISNQPTKAR